MKRPHLKSMYANADHCSDLATITACMKGEGDDKMEAALWMANDIIIMFLCLHSSSFVSLHGRDRGQERC